MQGSVIYKTLILHGEVSLAVLDTTALVEEAARRHGLSRTAAAALGRTLTGAAYLCSWLKSEKSTLTLTVDGGGPCGKLCVTGDGALHMRGFAENGQIELPPREDGKLNVGGLVGNNGTLSVVADDGTGLPFTGACRLVSGEIAEDLSAYFLTSEQRPTAVALGVLMKDNCLGAGGVFLQPLPGASEESIAFCEREIGKFASVSSLIAERGAEGVLQMFGAEGAEKREVSFTCGCSRKKAAAAVVSMGEQDARALLSERGRIEVHCHFCNTDHIFTEKDIDRLFGRHG